MADIYKSAGVLIENGKAILTRSYGKDVFVPPGGKLENGESGTQALVRELNEELGVETNEGDFTWLGEFTALAAGQKDKTVHMGVWIVKDWTGNPTATNEVEELARVDSGNSEGLLIGSIFEHDVMPKLKEMDLIN